MPNALLSDSIEIEHLKKTTVKINDLSEINKNYYVVRAFRLARTKQLFKSIFYEWMNQVFLDRLSHRWKWNLKLISIFISIQFNLPGTTCESGHLCIPFSKFLWELLSPPYSVITLNIQQIFGFYVRCSGSVYNILSSSYFLTSRLT